MGDGLHEVGFAESGCAVEEEGVVVFAGRLGDGLGGGYGQEFDADLASLEKIGAGGTDPGFAEELAELELPDADLAED